MSITIALSRNLPYLRQQFSALLHNTSPVITLIIAITSFGYLLSYSDTAVELLSVTPGHLLPNGKFWLWTAFTFCFIELHWWEVLIDVVTVGLCGKMLEPLWGQLEMLKFFALSNFGVAFATTIYYFFYYMVTKNPSILFNVHIHGLAGYVAGICVAVRQIMPDHLIFKTRYGRLTNRNLPLLVLIFTVILWAVNTLEGTYPAMYAAGLLVSWTYLRFYQYHPNGRGDSSESFTFASFFPKIVQPSIAIVVNPIYGFCLNIGMVKPPAPPRTSLDSTLTSVSVHTPGVDPHDIERRRQIALKALSERLKANDLNKHSHSQLPKSFPHPHKHHNHAHSHGHGHAHAHSHDHEHSHQGHVATAAPPFYAPNAQPQQPITTDRAAPRMITHMGSIAIPMPAPETASVPLVTAPAEPPIDISDTTALLSADATA